MLITESQTRHESLLQRHSATSYFLLTFAISWAGALVVVAPSWLRHTRVPRLSGILMFPAMLLGPLVGGLLMTRMVDGSTGSTALFGQVLHWRISKVWYATLLLPPLLVLCLLSILKHALSPTFTPNHFWLGIAFGIPAGICEEIGWMGFAFPKLRSQRSALTAAIILGLLWAAWHLPAINFLGAAAPHGSYWFHFFLAFGFAMTAMRVLIAWTYVNTRSLLLAQLMHISSTGALVIFSPAVTPAQEAMWYALYGCVLWIVVFIIATRYGRDLTVSRPA